MLKISECNCPICLINFNDHKNEPRILIKCGHSICLSCLKEKINFDEKILICPIDNLKYENINSVEIFPKNLALIELFKNKTLECLTSPQPKFNSNKLKLIESIKKINDKEQKINQICNIHPNKNLEIICLDDKCKICTNCALFGEHKNHNIINIDDFEKEIEIKSELLINLFDTIEKKFKDSNLNLENEFKYDNILKIINDKINNISNLINLFNKRIINKINNDVEKYKEEIKNKFNFLTEKISYFKSIPSNLKITIENWKNLVQNKLNILNEITDKDLDCSKLIESEKENGYNSLIEKGNSIINEYELVNLFPYNEIINEISKFSISFDENNFLSKSFIIIDKEINFNEIFNRLKLESSKSNNLKTTISDFSNEIINNSKELKDSDLSQIKNDFIIDLGKDKNNLFNLNEYDNLLNISDDIIFPNIQDIPKLSLKYNKSTTHINKKKNKNSKMIKSKTSRSPTPNKEKENYIKQQFKNKIVNLSRYKLCDDGALLISKYLEKNKLKISELKLTKCEISDFGIQNILKKIIECPNLISFNISNNFISDKSTDLIIESLVKNKSLQIVYLSNNNFSVQVKEKIRTYNKNGKLKIFI